MGRRLISRRVAAGVAGVDVRTIDRWRSNGLLATHMRAEQRNGREPFVMIDREELHALLAGMHDKRGG